MKEKRTRSARSKVSAIIFFVLLVQVLIFYLVFSKIEVLDMLEKSTYKYYSKRLDQTVGRLENKMLRFYSNKNNMVNLLQELENSYNINRDYYTDLKINNSISKFMMDTMDKSHTSGIFVYLNKGMDLSSTKDDLLFLRDAQTELDLPNTAEVVVEVGRRATVEYLGQFTDVSFESASVFENNKTEGLKKIVAKVKEAYDKSEIRDPNKLGFWTANIDLSGENKRNLLYIYPLINQGSGEIYGFVGMEIDHKIIEDILEVDTISSDFSNAFLLVQSHDLSDKSFENEPFYVMNYVGDAIGSVEVDSNINCRSFENKYAGTTDSKYAYNINGIEESDKYFILPRKLELYTSDSYYYSDEVSLFLLSDVANFHYNDYQYYHGIVISVLVSILIALILSFILSNFLTRPVRVLVKEIEKMDVSKKIRFQRTNIKEMDQLKTEIEKLSHDVGSFYFKMQNMLEVVGKALVILEEDREKGVVYRTGRISALLGQVNMSEKIISEVGQARFEIMFTKFLRVVRIESFYESSSQFKVLGIRNGDSTIYIKYLRKYLGYNTFHIFMDYTEEYNDILSLEREKNYDVLTMLPNRGYFKKLVTNCIHDYPNKRFVMAMWDLDNLKYINDIFGHDWGDSYLKQTAEVLKTLDSNIVYVSRFSGDEFFAFLDYDGDRNEVRKKIQALQNKLLSSKLEIGDYEEVKIRASVGLCYYPEDAQTYEDLHKFSDFAMYQAKHTNKGSIVEFDKELYERDNIFILGKEDFNRLVEEKMVKFAFQPIICARTGEVYAYEALMRTTSDKISSVDVVMKLARAQYKLPQVEGLTFEGVFDTLEDKMHEIGNKKVFINSIASVCLPNDKEELVKTRLAQYGDRVVVEITESEETSNEALKIKEEYRQVFGSLIAIDDFGSGYSTETSLLKVNPDFIKIDMGIIRDIHKDKNKLQLVSNIIEYSKIRGIKTIAEGIEVKEELAVLMELGADFIQGYYLAKPSFDIMDIPKDKKDMIVAIRKSISRNPLMKS